MHEISESRFNVLAGYARRPGAEYFGAEVAWFESTSGLVLATLIVDTDGELGVILFARDLAERFRWIGGTGFHASIAEALAPLPEAVAKAETSIADARRQGDEGTPMDFFEVVPDRTLHDRYRVLSEDPAWLPARAVVTNIMRWYEDGDGNFVEQFQTSGFDARIWEVYLFAMLVENGYAVSHPSPAPDFLAERFDQKFTIEATTINPSVIGGKAAPSQRPSDREGFDEYLENYLPIRFAGPLLAKLSKRYWEKPAAAGAPLVFAIQDFHDQLSMVYSGQALQIYLYGQRVREDPSASGGARRVAEKVEWHRWGTKEVESGFFELAGSENVSAVIFNGAGTLAKFNRIGVATGFESSSVRLLHQGARFVSDDPTNPTEFAEQVGLGYDETWSTGLWVFHNHQATHPLDPAWLPRAAHMQWDGNQFNSLIPEGHLDSSFTSAFRTAPESR